MALRTLMVFNINVHARRIRMIVTGLCIGSLLVACGGTRYQYLESDDGHVFAKIPTDWTIEAEGAVDFAYVDPTNSSFAFVAGDSTRPWRAQFVAGEADDVPFGYVEGQHVDARFRDGFLLSTFLKGRRPSDAKELERRLIAVGEHIGYRTSYTVTDDSDVEQFVDEVYLTDDRRSGVYVMSISCSVECHERHEAEFNKILTTFWVEP